jgi:hypothetical protein
VPRELRAALRRLAESLERAEPSAALRPAGQRQRARLQVQAHGFEARTRSALEGAFPRARARLGDAWLPLGASFVRTAKLPGNLGLIGRGFAEFLEHEGVATEAVDLARVEWSMVASSLLPRRAPLDLESLARAGTRARLAFQPHLLVLQTRVDVAPLLEDPRAPAAHGCRELWTYRQGERCCARVPAEPERRLHEALRKDARLAAAVTEVDPPEDALSLVLARWAAEELMCAVPTRSSKARRASGSHPAR